MEFKLYSLILVTTILSLIRINGQQIIVQPGYSRYYYGQPIQTFFYPPTPTQSVQQIAPAPNITHEEIERKQLQIALNKELHEYFEKQVNNPSKTSHKVQIQGPEARSTGGYRSVSVMNTRPSTLVYSAPDEPIPLINGGTGNIDQNPEYYQVGRTHTRSVDSGTSTSCASNYFSPTTSVKNSAQGVNQINVPGNNNNQGKKRDQNFQNKHDKNGNEFSEQISKAVHNEILDLLRNMTQNGSNVMQNITIDPADLKQILEKYIPVFRFISEIEKQNSSRYNRIENLGNQDLNSVLNTYLRSQNNVEQSFNPPRPSVPLPENYGNNGWNALTGDPSFRKFYSWWTNSFGYMNDNEKPGNLHVNYSLISNNGRPGNPNIYSPSMISNWQHGNFNYNPPSMTSNGQPGSPNYNYPLITNNGQFVNPNFNSPPINIKGQPGNIKYNFPPMNSNGQPGNPNYNPPPMNIKGQPGNPNYNPPSMNIKGQPGNPNYNPPPMNIKGQPGNPNYNPPPMNIKGQPGNPNYNFPPMTSNGQSGNPNYNPPPMNTKGQFVNPNFNFPPINIKEQPGNLNFNSPPMNIKGQPGNLNYNSPPMINNGQFGNSNFNSPVMNMKEQTGNPNNNSPPMTTNGQLRNPVNNSPPMTSNGQLGNPNYNVPSMNLARSGVFYVNTPTVNFGRPVLTNPNIQNTPSSGFKSVPDNNYGNSINFPYQTLQGYPINGGYQSGLGSQITNPTMKYSPGPSNFNSNVRPTYWISNAQ